MQGSCTPEGKLTRRMHGVIAALLSAPSYAEAARLTGVAEVTIYRWLKLPQFQAAYREARDRVIDHAIARLSALSRDAAEAIGRNLRCGNPGAEVRAATAVLQQLVALQSFQELERLVHSQGEQIRALVAASGNGRAAR
jgi:hypothetical protein